MNTHDLLDLLEEARPDYVWQAQAHRTGSKVRRLSGKKILLFAALIALMLALMGCTVAYVLSLQEKQVAQVEGVSHWDKDGNPVKATEVTQSVISYDGYQDSPSYQAAREWYEFVSTYDPEGRLRPLNQPEGISDAYFYSYDCYTPEMVEKLEEILRKNGLSSVGDTAIIQSWDVETYLNALGLDSLTHPQAPVTVSCLGGTAYPDGSFHMSVDFYFTGENPIWPSSVWSTVYYTKKDTFDPKYSAVNPEYYEEWAYTTADGTQLHIAMSAKGALIFAQQADAYLTVALNTDIDWGTTQDTGEKTTRKILEAMAEVFDFTIRPQAPDWDALKAQLAANFAAWEEEQQAMMQAPPSSPGFSAYLENAYQNRVIRDLLYRFADVNGDGEEELLLCKETGAITEILYLEDGEVKLLDFGADVFLCEEGVLEVVTAYDLYQNIGYYTLSGMEPVCENYLHYSLDTDQWEKASQLPHGNTDTPISAGEAAALRAKYSRLPLAVGQPLMEFKLENGLTLEENILQNQVTLSEEEILALYAEHIAGLDPTPEMSRSYYSLRDINGDGVVDLLLGQEETSFRDALTVSNGRLTAIDQWCEMNLCAGNILEITSITRDGDWNQYEVHRFYRLDPTASGRGGKILLEVAQYNPAAEQGYHCADGDGYCEEVIPEETYFAILAKYPRVALDMKPIEDFPE